MSCLEQALLGFDYCTPVMGTLTSDFGYREHPVEGEERFHYGIDIGGRHRYGHRLLCRRHRHGGGGEQQLRQVSSQWPTRGGYSTLYAHCSKILASSGDSGEGGADNCGGGGDRRWPPGRTCTSSSIRDSEYLNPIYYVSLA